ncbi:hypothetical protein FGF1_28440 [Flavobacteriaceae bacterium GF1]
MKKKYILALFVLGLACSDSTDVLEENFTRGGLVVWETVPSSFTLNFAEIETTEFSHVVEDPNENIVSYDLRLIYDGIVVDKFITLTTFPTTLTITAANLLQVLNLTPEEVDLSIPFEFLATITTTEGVFDGAPVDFDSATNTNNGGNSATELFDNPAFNQAISFSLNFLIPPPPNIGGTFFEEPFGSAGDYERNDPIAEGELFNNPGQPSVQHTALGPIGENEIGFRTFFSNPDMSAGSPGFDDENIGVTTDASLVGGFFDGGSQAYRLEDTDGVLTILFDRVQINPSVHPQTGIRIQFYPGVTGWESADFLTITAEVERGSATETVVLIDIIGDGDSEGNDIETAYMGQWNIATTELFEGVTAYTLRIDAQTGANAEFIYFDEMLIYLPE